MKLSECKHGVIVCYNKGLHEEKLLVIGMVVGLTENYHGEAIPLVQFQNNLEPRSFHHTNLSLYEE